MRDPAQNRVKVKPRKAESTRKIQEQAEVARIKLRPKNKSLRKEEILALGERLKRF